MNSNTIILAGAVFAGLTLFAPLIALPVGNHYASQLSSDDADKVSVWRTARFSYRISKLSPLLWNHASTYIREVDLSLSNSMFEMIIEGSNGGFNDEDHLLFLESREERIYWSKNGPFTIAKSSPKREYSLSTRWIALPISTRKNDQHLCISIVPIG